MRDANWLSKRILKVKKAFSSTLEPIWAEGGLTEAQVLLRTTQIMIAW